MIDLPQKLRLCDSGFCSKQSLLSRKHRAKANNRRFFSFLTEKLVQSEIGTVKKLRQAAR